MKASETRLNARKALTGKWGKAALITLTYCVIMAIMNIVLNLIPVIGPIVIAVIALPLSYGIIVTLINFKRGEDVSYTDFFKNGFNSFAKVWKTSLWTVVKMIIPVVLILVSILIIIFGAGFFTATATAEADAISSLEWGGAILTFVGMIALIVSYIYVYTKRLLYGLTFFVLNDNPDMTAKEAVEESARLMKGKRVSYFCLRLSFIGWMMLASISCGIGLLWLVPYIVIAEAVFYENLVGKDFNKNNA